MKYTKPQIQDEQAGYMPENLHFTVSYAKYRKLRTKIKSWIKPKGITSFLEKQRLELRQTFHQNLYKQKKKKMEWNIWGIERKSTPIILQIYSLKVKQKHSCHMNKKWGNTSPTDLPCKKCYKKFLKKKTI